MILPRGLEHDKMRVLKDGEDVTLSETDTFFDRFPTHEVIRIQANEYDAVPQSGMFTHFNLQVSNHRVGSTYLLPKILQTGYFDGQTEVLPLLDFEHVPYGTCVEVHEEMSYEDLTEKDFEYSFSHIKTRNELKEAIIQRYSKSMPRLSKNDILRLGVSKTTLTILGRL